MKSTVLDILGGDQVLHHPLNTTLDYIEVVKEGLPKTSLLTLQKRINISIPQLAKLVGTSQRNLSRFKETDPLPSPVTESTLQLAQIVAKGMEVFDDAHKFNLWLNEPNSSMDGAVPLEIMDSRYGSQLVLDILERIEWGIYS